VEFTCAGCGCSVDRGIRIESCGTPNCCCVHLPTQTIVLLSEQIQTAFNRRDMDTFHRLLAPDARWGDDDARNKCRSREDVIRTFKRLLAEGVRGEVERVTPGPKGVLARLRVDWPDSASEILFHVYVIRGDLIAEIRRFDDERSAVAAVSI